MESKQLDTVLPEFAGSRDVIRDLAANAPDDLTGTVVNAHAEAVRFVTVSTIDQLIEEFLQIRKARDMSTNRVKIKIKISGLVAVLRRSLEACEDRRGRPPKSSHAAFDSWA